MTSYIGKDNLDVFFHDDVAPSQRDVMTNTTIVITLDGQETRRLVEHCMGGPCFRIWLTQAEYKTAVALKEDWSYHQLKDGRWGVWRLESELDKIRKDSPLLAACITERRLTDDVT